MEKVTGAFRFVHPVAVRFSDVDIGGHAHHSKALVYVEEARAAFWTDIAGRRGIDEIDYILAEAEVRYHKRILYPTELRVGVRVSEIGRTSFTMEYAVDDPSGERLASARTVQVMYDYAAGMPRRVPDELRMRLEDHERAATGSEERT